MLAASHVHNSKARRDVNTLVGDYPLPDSLRPRLTPLAPNTKTPLRCADGGPRWSLTGPHSDAMLDRLDPHAIGQRGESARAYSPDSFRRRLWCWTWTIPTPRRTG